MSLQLGLALQAKGQMKREFRDQWFLDQVRAYAITCWKVYGFVHTDMLREWAKHRCLTPSHPNTWGAIFKGKQWKAVGRERSTISSNHGRFITRWEYQP